MSRFGLRTRSGQVSGIIEGNIDFTYVQILQYAKGQSYTLPSLGQQIKQNEMIVSLKNAGIWKKLDSFAVFATDGNSDFALIDWKRLTQYTAINSPTFTANEGFKGDGTSSYINTNFNISTDSVNYTQNNASRYFYLFSDSNTNGFDSINEDGTSNQNSVDGNMRPANTDRQCRINTTVGGLINSNYNYTTTSPEMKSVHRTSATNIEAFRNKTQDSRTSTSGAIVNANQIILRGGVFYNSARVSMYALGASLVAENDDFVDIFQNYINSI